MEKVINRGRLVKYGMALVLLTTGLAVASDINLNLQPDFYGSPTTINLSNINQGLYNRLKRVISFDYHRLKKGNSKATQDIHNQQKSKWQLGSPSGVKNILGGLVEDWENQNQIQSQNQNQ